VDARHKPGHDGPHFEAPPSNARFRPAARCSYRSVCEVGDCHSTPSRILLRAMRHLPSPGGGGSARIARCETGWGDLSTRAPFARRNCHPTPPLISFASTLPLQGRVSKRDRANSRLKFQIAKTIPHKRPHSRGAMRPRFAINLRPENRGRGECRAPDAPAASCALWVVSMHTSIHSESPENTRHSRTQWFTAYTALSPVIGFLATVAGGCPPT
jgi:hypothetical protein